MESNDLKAVLKCGHACRDRHSTCPLFALGNHECWLCSPNNTYQPLNRRLDPSLLHFYIKKNLLMQLTKPEVKDPWTLVLRSTSGTKMKISDVWFGAGISEENENLKSTDSAIPGVFKTGHLDTIWSQAKLVKVAIFSGGVEKAYITFDAEGVAMDKWFDQTRIISTSFLTLTPENLDKQGGHDFFTIQGQSGTGRRFYAFRSPGTCAVGQTSFWFVVLDGYESCQEWTGGITDTDNWPNFLYGRDHTWASGGGFDRGDLFAIFVKI